jgi:hypothetical protein
VKAWVAATIDQCARASSVKACVTFTPGPCHHAPINAVTRRSIA